MAAAALAACGLAQAGADEDADFGVPPTRELRLADHAAPTPREVPGARTVRTAELGAWLQRAAPLRPVLLDVLGGEGHDSIPGAVWLPGAGRGQGYDDATQALLARTLAALTGGEPRRALVFFCSGAQCWLSYNAALRAIVLGYREVHWYRGGIEAWVDADGSLEPMRARWNLLPN